MGVNKYKKEATPIKVNYNQESVAVDYNFERLLKSFMKDVEKRGIIKEVRDRRYYTKPSEERHKLFGSIKRKAKLARRRKK